MTPRWFGVTFNVGYLWLFAMVALVYLGSTIKDLPYSAWGAELSSDYHERTRITSWREGFSCDRFGRLGLHPRRHSVPWLHETHRCRVLSCR